MKKLLLLLLFIGCGNNLISNASSLFIDIFIIDGKCKSILYNYNNLKKENKKLALEYGQLNDANEASEDVLKDYQDRILDLSFQIDDEYRKLTLCNGGKTTNYIHSSYD